MGLPPRLAASAALALGLACNGCWFGRSKAASKVPPPPAPAVLPGSPVTKPADLPPLPAEALAPVPPLETPPVSSPPVTPAPKPAPPAKATPPPRRQPRQPATVPAPAPSTATVTPPAATPAPQLEEFLTTTQRRQYEAEFLSTLQRSRTALGRINGFSLSAVQKDTAERIRVFIGQAERERTNDIATALQLARRADLLGQDLLKSLQQ